MYSTIRLMPESEVCFHPERYCWTFELLCTYNGEEGYIKACYYGDESFKLSARTYANTGKALKQKGLRELLLTDETSVKLLEKINSLEKEMKEMIQFDHVQFWNKNSYSQRKDKYIISVSFKKGCMRNIGFYIDEHLSFIPKEQAKPKHFKDHLNYFFILQKETNDQKVSFIRSPETGIFSFSDPSQVDSNFLKYINIGLGNSCHICFYSNFIEDVIEKAFQHPALRVKLLTN